MSLGGPVAVTGATGRLGRAVIRELDLRGLPRVAWSRPGYDLDDPSAGARNVQRDRPALVIHAAAWTDVDGCARNPALAMRRNATATAELAAACAGTGASLILISTNEVFDGERTDGRGYTEDDVPNPVNPYGASKLAGERAAAEAFDGTGTTDRLTIVRTAWLYGPPGNDFPARILAAADRLEPGVPLRVVSDEIGSPTFTTDLATAVLQLAESRSGSSGVYHVVNAGRASRLDTARLVLKLCRPGVAIEAIARADFPRASRVPAWAVLDAGLAATQGIRLRSWQSALGTYARALVRAE